MPRLSYLDEEPAIGRAAPVIKTLFIKAGAVSLILLALLAFISAATHTPSDPSLNTATSREALNFGGNIGAIWSDIMLQLFGGGTLLWPVALGVWGGHILRYGPPEGYTPLSSWLHLGAWGLGVIFMAIFAASLPKTGDWPFTTGMGGLIGDGGLALLTVPLKTVFIPFPAVIAGSIALFLSASLTGYACGVRLYHLWAGWDALHIIGEEIRFRSAQIAHYCAEKRAQYANRKDPYSDQLHQTGLYEDEEDSDLSQNFIQDDVDQETQETPLSPLQQRRIIRKEKAKRPPAKKSLPHEADLSIFSSQNYQLPPPHLLAPPNVKARTLVCDEELEKNAHLLEAVLADFGVRGEIINVRPGPVVTLYELEPAAGVKSSKVITLADDIARSMSAIACRVAVVPGRNAIGIELPNSDRETVYLREMFAAPAFSDKQHALTISLGKNIGGEPEYADLAKMPHLLIAGTTGSGKSVGINTMILSMLYRLPPDQCKMIMIDPKMLELSVYEGIPHLLAPVVTDPRKAVVALKWTVREMEERYQKMSKVGVRNIHGFNERVCQAEERGEGLKRTIHNGYDPETGDPIYETEELDYEKLPYIVVIIDEVADLMMVAGKDIEGMVQRLAQMARAAGIHMIMATQRPSVDVITGTIKANFPTRISFQVTSKIDSRTILGEMGAEQLLGQGDMLFMAGGGRLTRVHGAFVADDEVENIVNFLKKQGKPKYVQEVTEMADEGEDAEWASGLDLGGNTSSGDALYDKALAVVLRDKKVSTSYIQRRLQIGYNKAATLIERMEDDGVISPANHAGKREILLDTDAA